MPTAPISAAPHDADILQMVGNQNEVAILDHDAGKPEAAEESAPTPEQIGAMEAEKQAAQAKAEDALRAEAKRQADQQIAAQKANRPLVPADATVFVLDITATSESPVRTHELIVDGVLKPFVFHHGKPLALPLPIALKFLKTESFKRTDAAGNVIEFKRRPKQPDELGAGEKIRLGDHETIARYDELSSAALLQRAAELPGGEVFAKSGTPDRDGMIEFIKETKAKLKKANTAKERDVGDDEFVPEAEIDAA